MSGFFTSALVIPALWHPLQRQDKIASSRPKVIMTVDPVAAQVRGSVVGRSAEATIARSSLADGNIGRGLEKEFLWSGPDSASS